MSGIWLVKKTSLALGSRVIIFQERATFCFKSERHCPKISSRFTAEDKPMIIQPQAWTTPQIRAEIQASTKLSQSGLVQKYREPFVSDKIENKPLTKVIAPSVTKLAFRSAREDRCRATQDAVFTVRSPSGDHSSVYSSGGLTIRFKRSTQTLWGLNFSWHLQSPWSLLAWKSGTKYFKDYTPRFVHIDINYRPQMEDGPHRRYLFVPVDQIAMLFSCHDILISFAPVNFCFKRLNPTGS